MTEIPESAPAAGWKQQLATLAIVALKYLVAAAAGWLSHYAGLS